MFYFEILANKQDYPDESAIVCIFHTCATFAFLNGLFSGDFFAWRMPFMSPNQQCLSTERIKCIFHIVCRPKF